MVVATATTFSGIFSMFLSIIECLIFSFDDKYVAR